MVPMDVGWNDSGSWSSLWGISKKDSDGNGIHGNVLRYSSINWYVKTDGKLVTGIYVGDCVVVCPNHALMAAHKYHVQL